jgi:hypothetical protein
VRLNRIGRGTGNRLVLIAPKDEVAPAAPVASLANTP